MTRACACVLRESKKGARKRRKIQGDRQYPFFMHYEIGAVLGIRFREKSPTFNITKSMSGDSVLSDDDDPDDPAYPCIRGRAVMRSNIMRCNDRGGAEENSHNQQ